MMSSDSLNWSAAILLALLLYGVMFLQRGAQMGIENATTMRTPLITHLTFNQTKKTVPDVPPAFKKPQPRHKPEPIKKIKTKQKPVLVKKSQPLEKIEKAEAVKQAVSQSLLKGQQVSISSDRILQQKRELYLQKLLSYIESFKFYPRVARRRSIEGNVKISFILRDNGHYEQLILNGERSVLVNATRIALEAASPLPIPDGDIELSGQIEFAMVYSLNQASF